MGSPDRQQLKSNKRPLSRGSTISSVLESYTVPHETFNGVLAEQSLRQPPQLESPSSASPNPTKPRSRWPLKNVFNRPKRHKKEHSGAVDTISSSPQDAETHSTSKFVSLQDLVYLLNQVHCQVWKCLKNHEAQATGHEASKTERGSDRLQAQLKQWAQIHVRLWNVIYKIWTEKFNQDNLPMNTPTSKRGLLENLKLLESKTCVPSLHLGHAKGVEFPQTPQIVKDCDTFLRSPEWSKFLVFMEFVDNMPSGFSEQALVNIAVTLVCGEADSTQETISQEPSFHPEQHTREAKAINVVCRFFGPRLPECLREIIRPWSKLPSAEYLLSSTFNNSPPPMEVSVFFGDNPYAKPTELLIETTVAAIVKNSPDTYWRVPKNMVRMRSLVSELHVLDIAAVFGLSNVVARLLSLRDVAHLQDTHPLQEITRSLYFAMVGPVIFCFGENHLEAMETVKPGSFFDGVNSIETVRKLVVRQKRIIGLLNDNRLADESDNQLTKANGHNSQRKQKTQSDQKDALRAAGDVPACLAICRGIISDGQKLTGLTLPGHFA